MSIERLKNLEDLLFQQGWIIINEYIDQEFRSIFEFNHEYGFEWIISRNINKPPLTLSFNVSDGMGRATKDLNDIFCCSVQEPSCRLFFSPINSSKWNKELKIFIKELNLIK